LFHETASFRLVCGDKHYIDWTVFFISFLPFIAYLFLANQQAYTLCNNHRYLSALEERFVAFHTTIWSIPPSSNRLVAQTATFERLFHSSKYRLRMARHLFLDLWANDGLSAANVEL
ncbi:hypothetical protein, partial [Paenibacillus sp. GCM10027626]|uniref:hypothetical protein n=1 Tax=Paenibacillus sp. GCM10027626 TaxID=3273411 RepID=UPI00363739FD